MHGYLSLDFRPEGADEVPSFDVHHTTAMIRADFENAASLEIALEWEHLAIEPGDFYLPHAFLDIKADEALIVRAGFFEVPVGAFNEYLYPDFLRITAEQPLFASQGVIPSLWSEVGLQLRGRFDLGRANYFTYAAFVSNGLEQHDPMPNDGIVAEGGDLRDMRFNVRDEFNGDKALGGRLGLEVGEFDFGVSGYTGRYTIERNRQPEHRRHRPLVSFQVADGPQRRRDLVRGDHRGRAAQVRHVLAGRAATDPVPRAVHRIRLHQGRHTHAARPARHARSIRCRTRARRAYCG